MSIFFEIWKSTLARKNHSHKKIHESVNQWNFLSKNSQWQKNSKFALIGVVKIKTNLKNYHNILIVQVSTKLSIPTEPIRPEFFYQWIRQFIFKNRKSNLQLKNMYSKTEIPLGKHPRWLIDMTNVKTKQLLDWVIHFL